MFCSDGRSGKMKGVFCSEFSNKVSTEERFVVTIISGLSWISSVVCRGYHLWFVVANNDSLSLLLSLIFQEYHQWSVMVSGIWCVIAIVKLLVMIIVSGL